MDIPHDNSDRRRSVRFPAHLPLRLQPVDARRQPIGDSIDAVSVDISQGGICCVSDRILLADYVIIDMQAAAKDLEHSTMRIQVASARK